MEKICKACEIEANEEQVKQMPLHTCGKDGPIEDDRPKQTEMEKANYRYNTIKKYLLEHPRLIWCTASSCACMGCVNKNDLGFKQSNPGLTAITEREFCSITIHNRDTEITRLRSELQQAKQEIANHIAVNSLLTDSDGEADLANKLYKATSELQQKDEIIKDLLPLAERMGGVLGTYANEHYKASIERAYESIKKQS